MTKGRARYQNPTAKRSRSLREESVRNLKGTGRRVLSRPRMTLDQAKAFLLANAVRMTSTELAFEMGVSNPEARKRCRELGLMWKDGWTNETPANAEDGFEPAPLPEGETFDAPGGSAERVARLRERAERGVELWDPKVEGQQLPRCLAKLEEPEYEPLL